MLKNLSLLLLLIAFVQPVFSQKKAEEAVKKAFENYKSAILNDKGAEAVKFVDSRTIKYYQDISDLVRSADSIKIESLSLLDKSTILTIRHRSTVAEQLNFNGKSLLVFSIKNGMTGKGSVLNFTLNTIQVEGNFAKAQIVSKGKLTPLYYHFYKEKKQWKLNMTSLSTGLNIALSEMIKKSNKTENDFIFSTLENVTGKRPGSEIWKPAQKD